MANFEYKITTEHMYFYILKCKEIDNTYFYKVGITKNIYNRFTSNKIPYSFELVSLYKSKSEDIIELESLLLNDKKQYRINSLLKFPGSSECISGRIRLLTIKTWITSLNSNIKEVEFEPLIVETDLYKYNKEGFKYEDLCNYSNMYRLTYDDKSMHKKLRSTLANLLVYAIKNNKFTLEQISRLLGFNTIECKQIIIMQNISKMIKYSDIYLIYSLLNPSFVLKI